jgi:hypothetical protein
MAESKLARVFACYCRSKPYKRKRTKPASATATQAIVLIGAIVVLFSVAYGLTFWLKAH